MRIMHVSTRLILGGSQENTVLSCEGQAALGHDVSLVYGPIYGPEGSLLERVEAHPGIDAILCPSMVRELAPAQDRRCLAELKAIIRDWKPDVVHTHSSKAGILGRMAAWALGVPRVVHTIHGLPFHPYERRWRNRIYVWSERFAAKRCHRIACVADAMRDQALAEGIGRPEQYETVWSGMETEAFLDGPAERAEVRRDLGLPEDAVVIGTVSRLAELKGHDDLLDAIGRDLAARDDWRLLWVGDGWWRERLLARAEALGVRNRIVTTGLVPPSEIPRMHRAMDVLVHPSWREGLPRVVTQAMLSGLPVVAHDVDGTREVCRGGSGTARTGDETGWLVAPGDHAALRAAVLEAIDDPAEARARAARGRELCRGRFAASAMVEHLERLYASIPGPPWIARDTTATGAARDSGSDRG